MEKNFKYVKADSPEPVIFEKIFAEKPGGGILPNQSFDVPAGVALGYDANGKLAVIKGYKVVAAAESTDTSIKIAKGSGIAVGDVLATGKKGVAVTAVDKSNDEYDTVTVSMEVALAKGAILYQAASASSSAAVPVVTPKYILGTSVSAGEGDQEVRLVNGANIRKETAMVADEVVALMKSIEKV
ncbi:MAG: hypothetical protein E7108_01885 [Bacteroidales bacterium]|jgi:hypothetical protein|nr:hypothetical protein [Bacteroidales bacterium]